MYVSVNHGVLKSDALDRRITAVKVSFSLLLDCDKVLTLLSGV